MLTMIFLLIWLHLSINDAVMELIELFKAALYTAAVLITVIDEASARVILREIEAWDSTN